MEIRNAMTFFCFEDIPTMHTWSLMQPELFEHENSLKMTNVCLPIILQLKPYSKFYPSKADQHCKMIFTTVQKWTSLIILVIVFGFFRFQLNH